MRDTTERPEGVEAGTLKLVGTDEEVIYRTFTEFLDNESSYNAMAHASNPYGDGHACERIADIIETGNCEEFGASYLQSNSKLSTERTHQMKFEGADIETPIGTFSFKNEPQKTKPNISATVIDVASIDGFTITDNGKNHGKNGFLVILAVDFVTDMNFLIRGCDIAIALQDDNEPLNTINVDEISYSQTDGDKVFPMRFEFPEEYSAVKEPVCEGGNSNTRIFGCLMEGKDTDLHPIRMDDLKEVRIMIHDDLYHSEQEISAKIDSAKCHDHDFIAKYAKDR